MNTIYEKNPKNWIWRFQTIDSYKALSNWQQRVFDILFLMMVNGTKKSNEQFSQLFNCSLTYWKETLKAFVDNKLLESNCKQVFNKELGHVMTTERILILNRNTFTFLVIIQKRFYLFFWIKFQKTRYFYFLTIRQTKKWIIEILGR